MTRAIKADFACESREEEGTRPAPVTLAKRAGAGRDFAQLMMEACRSLGIAARTVTSDLFDESLIGSETRMVGGGATHAWCEVYVPGAGWVEFDPTNGLIAGRNLIRVAVARTPEQAVPIGGSYLGEAEDDVGMSAGVEAAVRERGAADRSR